LLIARSLLSGAMESDRALPLIETALEKPTGCAKGWDMAAPLFPCFATVCYTMRDGPSPDQGGWLETGFLLARVARLHGKGIECVLHSWQIFMEISSR
jgi:hypothetical protein